MARFLFWSDLHLEFRDFDIPSPSDLDGDVDAILIAGDTDVKGRHLDFAEAVWDVWRRPVLMIEGNHEGYGAKRIQKIWDLEDRRIPEARARGVDIEILRGTSRVIGDTRIIGATFWTDLQLFPDRLTGIDFAVRDKINDYKRVRFLDERRGIYRKLLPQDTRQMHHDQKRSIYAQLAEPFDGPTVVMTHHLPVVQMMHPERREKADILSAAWASDLAHEISEFKVDAWIAGHSHDAVEFLLQGANGEIRFIRNIRGYAEDTTDFDPLRILDSNAPRLRDEAHPEVPRHEP
ncbi:metallophosphoesterase [Epibacterium sp. DP7N7-1]|nr:metallophosphoesterase [Epibacterium sp. DP7N7-1]